jgi:DNA-binding MarR family transcriptional regulator
MSASPLNDNQPAPRDRRLVSLHSGVLGLAGTDEPDLTMRQLGVLLICSTAKHPETVNSLSALLHVPKPIISRAIDKLEGLGLARRVRHLFDGRLVQIEATGAGHLLCKRFAGEAKTG